MNLTKEERKRNPELKYIETYTSSASITSEKERDREREEGSWLTRLNQCSVGCAQVECVCSLPQLTETIVL